MLNKEIKRMFINRSSMLRVNSDLNSVYFLLQGGATAAIAPPLVKGLNKYTEDDNEECLITKSLSICFNSYIDYLHTKVNQLCIPSC